MLLGTLLLALAATFAVPRVDAETASWSVEPFVYDFGSVSSNAGPSAPAVFTLTNTGEVDLPPPRVQLSYQRIESREPEIFDDDAFDCVVRANLMSGESCTTKVVFQPIYPGPRNGTIVPTDPSSEVASVSASFSGVGIGPIVSFYPSLLGLTAIVGEGPSLPPKVLNVTNEGDAGLSISGVSLVGENASHFAIVGGKCQPGAIVAPGASCGIQVTYSPTTAGFLFGELQLTDNAARGDQITGLQGNGFVPSPRRPAPLATFISRRPPKLTQRRFAAFRFGMEAQELVRFVCKLDRGPVRPCSSPKTYRHLALGPHEFRVRARTRAPDVSPVFSVARFHVIPRRSDRDEAGRMVSVGTLSRRSSAA